MAADDTVRLSIPAREYIDREVERAVANERESRRHSEEAVEKARQLQFSQLEQRLEGMNQFRAQLASQVTTFLPIDRFEREHTVLGDRLEAQIVALYDKWEAQIVALVGRVEMLEKLMERATGNSAGRTSVRELLLPNIPAVISMLVSLAALATVLILR